MMSYPMGLERAAQIGDVDFRLKAARLVQRTIAVPRALDEADAAIEHRWRAYDFVPRAVRTHLRIAVAEIVANIIEHGTGGRHWGARIANVGGPDRAMIVVTTMGTNHSADLASVTCRLARQARPQTRSSPNRRSTSLRISG